MKDASQRQQGHESLGQIARTGVFWSLGAKSVGPLLYLPATMILARLLTPQEFGIVAAAAFFHQLANQVGMLGLNAAIIRMKEVRQDHLSTVFTVNLVMGVVTCACLVAAAPLIAAFYRQPDTRAVLSVSALSFLVLPFGTVSAAVLRRDMRFKAVTIVDWISQATAPALSIFLALGGFGYWSLVYGRLGSSIVTTVARIYMSPWTPQLRVSSAALRDVVPFGAGIYAKRLLGYSAKRLDSLVVGRVLGITALGLYDKAFATMNKILSRVTIAPGVSFRVLATLQEDPARLRNAYEQVLLAVSIVGYPLFAGLIIVAPEFLLVLLGPQWTEAAVPFQILCGVGLLRLLNTYASSAAQAAGLIFREVWRQMIYVGLTLIGILVLRSWGIAGAAFAVLFATLTMTMLMWHLTTGAVGLTWRRILRLQWLGMIFAASVATALTLSEFLLRSVLTDPHPLISLVFQVLAGTSTYALLVLFSPVEDVRSLVYTFAKDLSPGLARRVRSLRGKPAR